MANGSLSANNSGNFGFGSATKLPGVEPVSGSKKPKGGPLKSRNAPRPDSAVACTSINLSKKVNPRSSVMHSDYGALHNPKQKGGIKRKAKAEKVPSSNVDLSLITKGKWKDNFKGKNVISSAPRHTSFSTHTKAPLDGTHYSRKF